MNELASKYKQKLDGCQISKVTGKDAAPPQKILKGNDVVNTVKPMSKIDKLNNLASGGKLVFNGFQSNKVTSIVEPYMKKSELAKRLNKAKESGLRSS